MTLRLTDSFRHDTFAETDPILSLYSEFPHHGYKWEFSQLIRCNETKLKKFIREARRNRHRIVFIRLVDEYKNVIEIWFVFWKESWYRYTYGYRYTSSRPLSPEFASGRGILDKYRIYLPSSEQTHRGYIRYRRMLNKIAAIRGTHVCDELESRIRKVIRPWANIHEVGTELFAIFYQGSGQRWYIVAVTPWNIQILDSCRFKMSRTNLFEYVFKIPRETAQKWAKSYKHLSRDEFYTEVTIGRIAK